MPLGGTWVNRKPVCPLVCRAALTSAGYIEMANWISQWIWVGCTQCTLVFWMMSRGIPPCQRGLIAASKGFDRVPVGQWPLASEHSWR